MTIYALVRPDNSIDRRSSNVDPGVQTRAGWRWLPVEVVGSAAHDPALQVKEGPVTTVESARVVDAYTVRAKTAQELDTEKETRIDQIDVLALRLIFLLNNEVRALKGQAALTAAQFRNFVRSQLT